jgi:hypothetical protein
MKKILLFLLSVILLDTTFGQVFKHTFQGTTVEYRVISVPKHEVAVEYVPKNAVSVTIPSEVPFNGEIFNVTQINSGGDRKGWLDALLTYGLDDEKYYAFSYCKLLKSVTLPNTIKVIGNDAFIGCTWLRQIHFSSKLENIRNSAFAWCESLTSIHLPSSVKVEDRAFYGCDGLKNITLSPKTGFIVKSIEGKKILVLLTDEEISEESFGKNYVTINRISFCEYVKSSPSYYLDQTKGKPQGSIVKRILLDAGYVEAVQSFYPNDPEVDSIMSRITMKQYIDSGDYAFEKFDYEKAKQYYEEALIISSGDNQTISKIEKVNNAILEQERVQAEQERQRKEAEEKARREKEIRDVESLVGNNIAQARSNRETGKLQAAAVLLQEGIDATISHNHDYRKEEMVQLLDTIRQLQSEVSDTSKVLDYKRFRPDLYEATDIRLTNRIQNYLTNRDKREKRNNISFTLNTFSQPGVFQIEKSSRALKEFSNTTVAVEKLQPLIIDESQVKAQASFNYTFEYASGTVKVKQKDALRRVNVKFDVSPDLEQKISTEVTDKMSKLSSWEYSGRYKFHVTSMDINGQMHHTMILKKVHLYNGPQNFLRSLIVPGWGDKYVKDDRKFDWWKTVISYGATAAGTGIVLYTNKMKKAQETISYEKVVTGYNSDGTPIYYDKPVSNSTNNNGLSAYYGYIGYGLIAVGVGMWLYDVIYVGVKGTKNKNEEKAQMGWYLTYEVANNAPEVGYSLRF